jgi:hypothetical protein
MILLREIPGTEFPLAHHLKSFQRNGNVRNAVLVSKKKESSRRWTNNLSDPDRYLYPLSLSAKNRGYTLHRGRSV